jgi:hypothetical protein
MSLNTQIREAQRRVSERHRTLGACAAAFRHRVLVRAASGPGLLLAGSIGFITAEIARLLDAGARARSTPGARGALLRNATRIANWGRILFAFFP